eukprot:gene1327-14_t
MEAAKIILSAAAFLLLIYQQAAAASDVIELDPTSFNKMLQSDDIWMVEFYAKLDNSVDGTHRRNN